MGNADNASRNTVGTNGLEVSLDIETLAQPSKGSGRNLVMILSIGAVVFNPNDVNSFEELAGIELQEGRDVIGRVDDLNEEFHFYSPISLHQSLQHGFDVDASTAKFWEKNARSDSSYNMLAQAARHVETIEATFGRLARFLRQHKLARVWAKSPTFDCVIVREAFNKLGMDLPIEWWTERDVRTLIDIGDVSLTFPSNFIVHHALHDAAFEAMQVQEFNRAKRETKLRLAKLELIEREPGFFAAGCIPVLRDGVWVWHDPNDAETTTVEIAKPRKTKKRFAVGPNV